MLRLVFPWETEKMETQFPESHDTSLELKMILAITRRLPPLRGAGVVGNIFKRLYLRRAENRRVVETDLLGFRMRLDPAEMVDGGLLFFPQVYDHREIRFLKDTLGEGDIFIDVGANIGFYSLVASRLVGRGRVIAIEADPHTFGLLRENLAINKISNVTALNVGASDRQEVLELGINTQGNRGESSFLLPSGTRVTVECKPLHTILREQGIEKFKGAKLDIEGFEQRVLAALVSQVARRDLPDFLIVEDNPVWNGGRSAELSALLERVGYASRRASRLNRIFTRSGPLAMMFASPLAVMSALLDSASVFCMG